MLVVVADGRSVGVGFCGRRLHSLDGSDGSEVGSLRQLRPCGGDGVAPASTDVVGSGCGSDGAAVRRDVGVLPSSICLEVSGSTSADAFGFADVSFFSFCTVILMFVSLFAVGLWFLAVALIGFWCRLWAAVPLCLVFGFCFSLASIQASWLRCTKTRDYGDLRSFCRWKGGTRVFPWDVLPRHRPLPFRSPMEDSLLAGCCWWQRLCASVCSICSFACLPLQLGLISSDLFSFCLVGAMHLVPCVAILVFRMWFIHFDCTCVSIVVGVIGRLLSHLVEIVRVPRLTCFGFCRLI